MSYSSLSTLEKITTWLMRIAGVASLILLNASGVNLNNAVAFETANIADFSALHLVIRGASFLLAAQVSLVATLLLIAIRQRLRAARDRAEAEGNDAPAYFAQAPRVGNSESDIRKLPIALRNTRSPRSAPCPIPYGKR